MATTRLRFDYLRSHRHVELMSRGKPPFFRLYLSPSDEPTCYSSLPVAALTFGFFFLFVFGCPVKEPVVLYALRCNVSHGSFCADDVDLNSMVSNACKAVSTESRHPCHDLAVLIIKYKRDNETAHFQHERHHKNWWCVLVPLDFPNCTLVQGNLWPLLAHGRRAAG